MRRYSIFDAGCEEVRGASVAGPTGLFQAEDGIRDAQESRGLGDVYKRQR